MTVNITNIVWDFDDDPGFEGPDMKNEATLVIQNHTDETEEELIERITDYLSEVSGWTVKGFNYTIVK